MTSNLWMSIGFFAGSQKESDNSRMTDRPAQRTSYPLRMPDELRDKLEEAAKKSNRSLHSEIVARLQQSFELSSSGLTEETAELLSAQLKALLDSRELHSKNKP